jgi:hypothetical protein
MCLGIGLSWVLAKNIPPGIVQMFFTLHYGNKSIKKQAIEGKGRMLQNSKYLKSRQIL